MIVELVNTGSELMLGRVLNTHQQWLCRRLSDMGYAVARQVAVPDTGPDIQKAVQEALSRADVVVVTGGLGPTSDDLTRELIAQMLGRTLREDPSIVSRIRNYFQSRGRVMPARTALQALVPEGALVLDNPNGTAPGLAMKVDPNPFREGGTRSWLVMLPGPPRELRPMFEATVRPLLERELPPSCFVCRVLRTTGIGESLVEELVDGPLKVFVQSGLELGYCARTGQVDVRLAARGSSAAELVTAAEQAVRPLLAVYIYGEDEDDLETAIVRELTVRKETLSLAESCTGGLLAHRLTNVPGASAVMLAGVVTYSNESKESFLGVDRRVLAEAGAVSEEVARAMAEGMRRRTGSTYSVSITGIAGPGGGTEQKPVGTVYIGLAGPSGTKVTRSLNACDRETFKHVTTQQAMSLLRAEMRCLVIAR